MGWDEGQGGGRAARLYSNCADFLIPSFRARGQEDLKSKRIF